jgi:signal transduction histidine kinase
MMNKKRLAITFILSWLFFALAGIFAANRAGELILAQYGYSGSVGIVGVFDLAVILCGSAVFALLLTLALAVFAARDADRRKQRVADLTAYLRRMNSGDYTLRPNIQEDELSPLEDEIYKSVVLLREGRELSQKEKQKLADNLSDIAHQLKTPLAAIALMSDLLETGLTGSQAEYVRRISAQTERLNALAASLLALSRLDAGTLPLDRKPVDTRELFLSVKEAVLPLLEGKGQTLRIPNNDAGYLGDFHWSTQAFINILKNAGEHTPEGGEITVRWEENPVCTVIVVEDNGPGIPAEDLPHLFKRFYRGKNANLDSVGIGLSLAKALIERQNGELTAGNRPEGGAVFTVKFYHGI